MTKGQGEKIYMKKLIEKTRLYETYLLSYFMKGVNSELL